MSKSALDVMQQIIFGAVVDAISAMKSDSNGMPNILLRDIASMNPNANFSDLPKSVQQVIKTASNDGFKTLLREGYTVAPKEKPSQIRNAPIKRKVKF